MHHKLQTKQPLILIVDDTPSNIDVLAETLESDYRIKIATHGRDALNIAAHQDRPDLILLDVMMPEMDGYEVCRKLKQTAYTKDIPVIFITARAEADSEKMGLNLGAMDYITKPFDVHVVKARVYNHINLKIKTDLLESLALMDGLTNIPNRRHFDNELDKTWRQAQRAQSPISLVMADVDHFKAYNDHYGHRAGDLCLQKVAETLSSQMKRPLDLAARYGGEEFVLLLPDTDAKGAQSIAERCRKQIEALAIPHRHSETQDILTLSLGMASITPSQMQPSIDLLDRADQMLYQAKTQGRNCVRVFAGS